MKQRTLARMPALVDPYLPIEGITLIHGNKGVGKSPFGWHLAHCVATGAPFWGNPIQQSRVLTVEVDTPEAVVLPRIQALALAPTEEWIIYCARPFNVRSPMDKIRLELVTLARDLKPGLVIINTLRKVYDASEKESEIASSVYIALQQTFPGASILAVHHDRKSGGKADDRPPEQAFSGSRVWADDAQSVIHLTKHATKTHDYILVEHTGCQYAAPANSLSLVLDLDGSNFTLRKDAKREKIEAVLQSLPPDLTRREQVARISDILGEGFSQRTVWRVLSKDADAVTAQ